MPEETGSCSHLPCFPLRKTGAWKDGGKICSRSHCQVRTAGTSRGFQHGFSHGLDNFWLQGSGYIIVHINFPLLQVLLLSIRQTPPWSHGHLHPIQPLPGSWRTLPCCPLSPCDAQTLCANQAQERGLMYLLFIYFPLYFIDVPPH